MTEAELQPMSKIKDIAARRETASAPAQTEEQLKLKWV